MKSKLAQLEDAKITRTGRNRPVVARNGWGEERIFNSGREAARVLGLRQSGVNYCLTGQRQTTGGYRFRYLEDSNE